MAMDFPVATILLGFVLGPLVEENFRRALLLSRGDLLVFFERPISATFMAICILIVLGSIFFAIRRAVLHKQSGLIPNISHLAGPAREE
jgi:TctA family transporter